MKLADKVLSILNEGITLKKGRDNAYYVSIGGTDYRAYEEKEWTGFEYDNPSDGFRIDYWDKVGNRWYGIGRPPFKNLEEVKKYFNNQEKLSK